jgi:hypothetical protein
MQEAYGDRVSIRFVMGGLVGDSKTFSDPINGIGGDDRLQPIADHWVDASRPSLCEPVGQSMSMCTGSSHSAGASASTYGVQAGNGHGRYRYPTPTRSAR